MSAPTLSVTVRVVCDDGALLVTLADDTDLPTRNAIRSLAQGVLQRDAHVVALRCPSSSNELRVVVSAQPAFGGAAVLGEAIVQVSDQPVRVTSVFGQRFFSVLLSPPGEWRLVSSRDPVSAVPWQLTLWPQGTGVVSVRVVDALYGVAPMKDAPF